MINAVLRQERGWAGHFICAHRCRFRRNTLLTCNEIRLVISTVGLMDNVLAQREDTFAQIGCGRYFETMVFHAKYDGRYWDADVSREVSFDSPWCVNIIDGDDIANNQHEAVVEELTNKLQQGIDIS